MSANTVFSSGEIRAILGKRIDLQKQGTGIVAGIIEPGGRRFVAYGALAQGDARAVDGDTIFEIGSVSKVFTSLLLADMVTRHEVSLDDPAGKYLPGHVRMPERSGQAITLLDLATHRSGLPPLPGNNPLSADYSVEDLYEFLSRYALPRDPGSEYEYSNLGAGLLGHLLALRAGTDYESLIRSRITGPLGMADTGITLSSAQQERMAIGHNAMLAPVAGLKLSALAGAGALRSSANDMLTLLEAFLGYGPAQRESPLAAAMKAMLEVRLPAGKMEIGLGWLILAADGREITGHNGGTPGFRATVGFDAVRRIGVVVLCNASTAIGGDDIGLHLLNPKAPLADPAPPEARTEVAIDAELLDHYIGRYQVTPNLIFEITREGGRLFAQGLAQLSQNPAAQNPPGELTKLPRFELFAEGEKKFFAKVADSRIAFETGPDGRATSLVLRRGGRDLPAALRLS